MVPERECSGKFNFSVRMIAKFPSFNGAGARMLRKIFAGRLFKDENDRASMVPERECSGKWVNEIGDFFVEKASMVPERECSGKSPAGVWGKAPYKRFNGAGARMLRKIIRLIISP